MISLDQFNILIGKINEKIFAKIFPIKLPKGLKYALMLR